MLTVRPSPCQFWDVCTVEHLLARLAVDTQCICKRITNLLLRSFFPVSESEAEWCRRCVTLIQMNPMAARKFYLHVHLHVEPTNIGKRAAEPPSGAGGTKGRPGEAFTRLVRLFQSS